MGDENLTDEGNALRFIRLAAGTARYVVSWGKWAVWNGKRWEVETCDVLASALAREVIADLHRQADELEKSAVGVEQSEAERLEAAAAKIRKWALRTENGGRFDALLAHAASSGLVWVDHNEFNADPLLFNCANGVIDLRTGELRPHAPEFMMTRASPVAFDPDASAPRWEAHLRLVTGGNEELIDYLQRAVGYSLTGMTTENVMFILYGSGANGKSTTLEVLRLVMGDYADTAAPDLLIATGDRHPTELADLYGRRFVYSHEVDDGGRLAESKVKRLTGNDLIKARRMHENFWSFSPTHKLWLGTNHKPVIRGTDHAIWRRIRLIPFVETIPPAARDPFVLEKLKAELPGILAWAVRGCLEWQRRGLADPPVVREATETYRTESDVLGSFLMENCVRDEFAVTTARDLYDAYKQWAEAVGERVMTRQMFGRRLSERGLVQHRVRTGHSAWRGVRLLRPGEAVDRSWESWRGGDGEAGTTGYDGEVVLAGEE
jgi:putative DNA primase/helicase